MIREMKTYGRKVLASMTVLSTLMCGPVAAQDQSGPIKIVVTGITDADFIANVYATFLEQQGFEVERIKADYAAQFVGLEAGDLDFSTSIWETSRDIFDAALATGDVVNMGATGVKIREGWWYPTYVEEVCPGLPDWKALLETDCVEALSTIETSPLARFVEAPADWTTNNVARVKSLELPYSLESTGTPAALHAAIVGPMQRKEPVIGWGFAPDWMTTEYEGKFVEFPDFELDCINDPAWGADPNEIWDCDNPAGYVWKVAHAGSEAKFPRAARILRLFQLKTDDVAWGVRRVDVDGVDSIEAATEWLAENADITADWAL